MLVETIKRFVDKNGLNEELHGKIDVLFLAGRLNEDDYLSTINKDGYHVERIDDHTLKLVKDDVEQENDGTDYIRPITYTKGMSVTAGLWYTDESGNVWDAIKDGTPKDFEDKEYFGIID